MPRVLVMDDEPFELARYVAELGAAGFEVVTAADGAQAIANLALGPDLIILDLIAPGLDGYEVLKHLRRTAGHITTPVIIASGVATGDWAIHLGADLFLRKPIAMTALVSAIHELLSTEGRR